MFNSGRKDFVLVSTLDILFIYLCMCTHVCMHVSGDETIPFGGQYSHCIMWILGIDSDHHTYLPLYQPYLLNINSTYIRQIPCSINKCKISQVMACRKTGHWREGLVECSCRKSQFSSKTHVQWMTTICYAGSEDLTFLLASVGICMYVHISAHK